MYFFDVCVAGSYGWFEQEADVVGCDRTLFCGSLRSISQGLQQGVVALR
jgi:hypothetical protein